MAVRATGAAVTAGVVTTRAVMAMAAGIGRVVLVTGEHTVLAATTLMVADTPMAVDRTEEEVTVTKTG